jgi:hypothetical protein
MIDIDFLHFEGLIVRFLGGWDGRDRAALEERDRAEASVLDW